MFVLAVFLILLVLVQRGRGGGLTGALGGMGGSSAFGAKAGDIFTRITIVTAAVWIVVCVAAVYWATNRADVFGDPSAAPGIPEPVSPALPGESAAAPAGMSTDTASAASETAPSDATSDASPPETAPSNADQ
jgi:preprotein translocase subunit SecG